MIYKIIVATSIGHIKEFKTNDREQAYRMYYKATAFARNHNICFSVSLFMYCCGWTLLARETINPTAIIKLN